MTLISAHWNSNASPPSAAETTIADNLDKEARAIVSGDGSTLECQPVLALGVVEEGLARMSGRVVFTANLNVQNLMEVFRPYKKDFSQTEILKFLTLKPLRLGDSSLFTRVFGSHRFIRISLIDRNKYVRGLTSQQKAEVLLQWLKRPLNIFGRIYRAFTIKDDVVWYFMEGKDRLGVAMETFYGKSPGQYGPGSIVDNIENLVNWWIHLERNKDQLICKLVSRFHLGISGTTPGLLLHKQDEVEWTHDISKSPILEISQAQMHKNATESSLQMDVA
jgi:hypothetical protein